MERSDGRRAGSDGLATVSYLFGVPNAEPEQDELPGGTGPGHTTEATAEATAEAESPAPSERDIRMAAHPAFRDPGPGWYTGPDAVADSDPETGSTETDSSATDNRATGNPEADDEHASLPTEQPAGAVAAARAFLTAVETTVAVPEATQTVRFVAEEEEDDDTSADSGRKKPPPVRQASLNALARKGMSSAEMANLLEAREVDPDEAAAEVERLEGVGLLDDRVLAEHLVRTLQDRKGLGRSAINAELRRRQVDQAAIDEALDTVDVDDELERCIEVATKRASQLSAYDRTTAERRLSAYLMRRGYAGSVISAAVAKTLGPAGPRFR